jgi:uncharacterized surface protein with fasciclin (FAS1) repeats
MYSSKTIISNVLGTRELTVLAGAMRSVRLDQPLLRNGTYTLFAPPNDAFSDLPADLSKNIFRRSYRKEMAKILACHIVSNGPLAGTRLRDVLAEGQTLYAKTLGGCVLVLERSGGAAFVTDETGRRARIIEADIAQANGMIQITDRVLLPSL